MERPLVVALVILAGVLALSLLSRSVSSETRLGGYASATVRRSADRLCREAALLRDTAHQDELDILALVHTVEGLGAARAARGLCADYGLREEDAKDLVAELEEELDGLLAETALRSPAPAASVQQQQQQRPRHQSSGSRSAPSA